MLASISTAGINQLGCFLVPEGEITDASNNTRSLPRGETAGVLPSDRLRQRGCNYMAA